MTQTIRIDIKEYNDFTHPYFLATSEDVPELLVQGRTVEEVLELAPGVVAMIFEENQKIAAAEQQQSRKTHFSPLPNKSILMQYIYNQHISLQPA